MCTYYILQIFIRAFFVLRAEDKWEIYDFLFLSIHTNVFICL